MIEHAAQPIYSELLLSNKHTNSQITENARFIAEHEKMQIADTPYLFIQDQFVSNGSIFSYAWREKKNLPSHVTVKEPIEHGFMTPEGGRLVLGNKYLFWAHKLGFFDEAKEQAAALFYPNHKLVFLETAEDMRSGLAGKYRVASHIDQFIGADLPTIDGRSLVPVDSLISKWNELSRRLEGDIVFEIPTNLLNGSDPNWNYQLLNYVRAPKSGTTYICPKFRELLEIHELDKIVDFSKVKILPHSVENNKMISGLKCSINFC